MIRRKGVLWWAKEEAIDVDQIEDHLEDTGWIKEEIQQHVTRAQA